MLPYLRPSFETASGVAAHFLNVDFNLHDWNFKFKVLACVEIQV